MRSQNRSSSTSRNSSHIYEYSCQSYPEPSFTIAHPDYARWAKEYWVPLKEAEAKLRVGTRNSPEFSVNTPQESSPRRAFTGPTKPDVEYDMQTPDFWKQFRAADETQVPNDNNQRRGSNNLEQSAEDARNRLLHRGGHTATITGVGEPPIGLYEN